MARYTVVIGIQSYSASPLPSLMKSAADAEDMAIVLEEYGNFQSVKRLPEQWSEAEQRYHVHPKSTLSGEAVGRSLRDFLLTQAHKHDALIYFSGHGIKPGITPLAELMAVMKPYFPGTRELKRLDELATTHPDGLRQIANHLDSTSHLLVIDQFEELFTVLGAMECDRLRYSPVCKNPPDETAREACEFSSFFCVNIIHKIKLGFQPEFEPAPAP